MYPFFFVFNPMVNCGRSIVAPIDEVDGASSRSLLFCGPGISGVFDCRLSASIKSNNAMSMLFNML